MGRIRRAATAVVGLTLVVLSTQPASVGQEGGRTVVGGGSDALFVEVGRQVEGFGGAYIEADGTRYVWLTAPSGASLLRARSALAERVGGEFATGDYAARRATYSFERLNDWHDRIIDVLALDGVVLTDINDRTNRLTVGVENLAQSREAVAAEIRRAGVPEEAVEVEEMSPFRFVSSVRDSHRPMVGGLQIEGQAGAFGITATRRCSLGVITVRSSVTGFVTNSHCSRTQGEVDNGRYWQSTRPLLDTGQVGTETVDPPYNFVSFNGTSCPSGRRCRISDANFVAAQSGVTVSRGFVARPSLGATSWNGTSTFRITNQTNPTSGTVTKVGRTTGRTAGTISNSCVRIDVADSDITLFCQNIANAGVDHGDSGSPVFKISNSPSANDVELVGILWGGNDAGDLVRIQSMGSRQD